MVSRRWRTMAIVLRRRRPISIVPGIMLRRGVIPSGLCVVARVVVVTGVRCAVGAGRRSGVVGAVAVGVTSAVAVIWTGGGRGAVEVWSCGGGAWYAG